MEVKTLRDLTGHPNIAKFYKAFEDVDNVYIVMELCEGGDLLERLLSRGWKYSEDQAKSVLVQILNAVAYYHIQGIIHSDLKPENFLFSSKDEDSHLKVVDFGLSTFVKQALLKNATDAMKSSYVPYLLASYWVSQGNKRCDICKIWISNNPASIRNHELGQRHKANVSQKLSTMREEKAAKDKEQKAAVRIMEQIESKAKRSYQKDLASFQEARDSNANALLAEDNNKGTGGGSAISEDWEYESTSGYYYNQRTSCYYDPNSGFYYTDSIGKWVTREEDLAASQESSESSGKKSIIGKPPLATANKPAIESKSASISQTAPPPGCVVFTPLNPMRSIKGAPSSVTVSKRKWAEEKPQAVSEEEAVAIKAREAAKKRVEKREKHLLGLYKC